MTDHVIERDGYDELADYVKAIKKRVAATKKKVAKKAPARAVTNERLTVASLEDLASGLEHGRRNKYGDGVRAESERGGMGLYETSMRLTEAGGFELVYSTGGHGGPYPNEAAAKSAAARRLKGNERENWIAVIAAKDTSNLTKAKALWVIKQNGDWVKGPQPLPGVSPRAHFAAQSEALEEGNIPGLPTGWSSYGKNKEARWTSKNGHEYRVLYEVPHGSGGWMVVHFKPNARTGDQLKVSDFDAKWKSKMLPLNANDTALFPHAFSAADAAVDYDKKHDSKESLADKIGKAISEAGASRHMPKPVAADKNVMLDLSDLSGEKDPVSLASFIKDNSGPDAVPLDPQDLASLRKLRVGGSLHLDIGGGAVVVRRKAQRRA